MRTDAERLAALEKDVRSLRAELEQARVIAVPHRTTEVRTIDEVPAGHGRGQCDECGGFHPVDGEPRH